MRRIVFFLVILAPFKGSYAQIISVDKTDTSAYVKKNKWAAAFSLGLEVDKQNKTLLDLSNFADASLQHFKDLFIASGSNRVTSDGSRNFLNTGYLHWRWRHDYKNRVHPETFLQYQWDEQRGMRNRFVGGENLRYLLWRQSRWDFSFATGLMYEREQWNYTAVDSANLPAVITDQRSRSFKSNNYVRCEVRSGQSGSLAAAIFYQARFSDFFRPRWSAFISYDVAISKSFSLGVRYSGLYDTHSVVPIARFYYSLITNVSVHL